MSLEFYPGTVCTVVRSVQYFRTRTVVVLRTSRPYVKNDTDIRPSRFAKVHAVKQLTGAGVIFKKMTQ